MQYQKKLFYSSRNDMLSIDEWIEQGSPLQYVLEYKNRVNGDEIEIWVEHGFGGLLMKVNDDEFTGKNIVQNDSATIVAFSEYYGLIPYVPYIKGE